MHRADIHFHILPGVDDGPETLEESLQLAWLAVRDGTRSVVATPHIRREFLGDPREVPERVAELQDRLEHAGIPLEVLAGGELDVEMVGSLDDRALDRIAVGGREARWLLHEAPFEGLAALQPAAAELRARGYGVVIAHPERAAGVLTAGCRVLRDEIAAGALSAVSASSLTGDHGHESQVAGNHLVDMHLAHVLASDAHSTRRAPHLSEGMDRLLASGHTFATARRLVDLNPYGLVTAGMPARVAAAA
jgi:protein-tyrosine phosphatase